MENCIVKKYRGKVNDNSLIKYDILVLNILKDSTGTTTEGRMYIQGIEDMTVKVVGSGAIAFTSAELISDPKTELTVTRGLQKAVYYKVNSGSDYQIEIKSKYNINKLQCVTPEFLYVDFSQLEYLENLLILQLKSQNFSSEMDFDCSHLVSLINLMVIPDNLVINIETLKNCVDLESVELNAYAHGDVEALVSGFVSNGRSSETTGLSISNINYSHITFGDNYLVNNGKLTWNGTSKITFITTNVNKVYCKGATAEEIAAWEQAGKTVFVIS